MKTPKLMYVARVDVLETTDGGELYQEGEYLSPFSYGSPPFEFIDHIYEKPPVEGRNVTWIGDLNQFGRWCQVRVTWRTEHGQPSTRRRYAQV